MFSKSWTELDAIELDAFLGLLILHGVNHESKKPLCQLWNEAKGRPIYNATMSRNRFSEISSALRFDNKKSRYLRELTDKLAHIRELFELWVPTLRNSYLPGPYLTIDEQLYSFHGHRKFKQYIPKKPSKYGLKNSILADSASKYCCNIQVYTGKSPGVPPERNQGRRVVLDLVQYLGVDSGRNVTTDNFFTDLELGKSFLLLKRNITLVGTMRKNKPEIPAAFLPSRESAEFSSLFGFTKEAALVSYVPKIGKAVILLSTTTVMLRLKRPQPQIAQNLLDLWSLVMEAAKQGGRTYPIQEDLRLVQRICRQRILHGVAPTWKQEDPMYRGFGADIIDFSDEEDDEKENVEPTAGKST
ncbi:uncharacterized protein LOC129600779 [Paramacrobiotus metropolitanus]|uniref:uncharacterized protein LOC129600779 n=1 Tax=Paramacrobiotus metropolitanus TaxID=2943436 RepID=UPI0024461D68|nr:uncharacterized protein LOC129600779 [Paramacrobiotus metropolitanus]